MSKYHIEKDLSTGEYVIYGGDNLDTIGYFKTKEQAKKHIEKIRGLRECDYCGKTDNRVKKTNLRGGWDNHILSLHPNCKKRVEIENKY